MCIIFFSFRGHAPPPESSPIRNYKLCRLAAMLLLTDLPMTDCAPSIVYYTVEAGYAAAVRQKLLRSVKQKSRMILTTCCSCMTRERERAQ